MNSREAGPIRHPAFPRTEPSRPRARCVVVVSSRRDAVNLFPVIKALDDSDCIDPYVVLAGPFTELVEPVLQMAGVSPDVDLRAGLAGRTVNQVIAGTVSRFDKLLTDLRRSTSGPAPAAVLVHGSSTAALGAALASAGTSIPVIHIETDSRAPASARTQAASLPGDFNLRMLTRLASLSIAPTMADLGRLVSEGVSVDDVYVTGSTAVDAFVWAARQQAPWPDQALERTDADGRPVIVVNVRHPGAGTDVSALAKALAEVAAVRPDALIAIPIHPAPEVRSLLLPAMTGLPNVVVTKPLSYPSYARLVSRATLAVSDSLSLQQEAPSVGTAVIATNATTRRQMGSEAGTTLFVGSDPRLLAEEVLRLLDDDHARRRLRHAPNPFGDGHAAERIVLALEHLLFDGPPPAPFVRDGTWSLPTQRTAGDEPARCAADPVTHAFAELTALAYRTHGSPQPSRRGRQDW